ncbi:MAG: hypothetical protein IPL96_11435 [Holophagaceae bacterium]|nr:hypothetical protein [Holophagaceae bacterium]
MIPVLTAAEMRALERVAIDSGRVTSLELQERAAAGAVALLPAEVPVELVAGPGNNGGDALAVARLLKQRGQHVRVWAPGAGAQLEGATPGCRLPLGPGRDRQLHGTARGSGGTGRGALVRGQDVPG